MESNRDEQSRESEAVPSSSEARAVLSRLDSDGAHLAARVVTPWWYHAALALIVSLFVASQALPAFASITLIALGIIALPLLTHAYRVRYGLSVTQPIGRRSRRLLYSTLGVLALAMIAGLIIRLSGVAWAWVLVPAAVAAGVTLVLGRRYDDALRGALAGDDRDVA